MLLFVLVYFAGLGVHAIIAAFLVGLLLSDIIQSESLRAKIHTLGYGIFVPVFFFIIGMQLDLFVLKDFDIRNVIMLSIVFGLIALKFTSGYIGSRLSKFKPKESLVSGIASTAQLTTTLAATYAAAEIGILDNLLITSIIILSIITTILVPIGLGYIKINGRGRKSGST